MQSIQVFFCYGSMRELLILLIAGIPAYFSSKAMDWYTVNIKKQTIDRYAEFRFNWLVAFLVSAIFFYIWNNNSTFNNG
jgi:cytochrome c oxidase assembly factor CtaG